MKKENITAYVDNELKNQEDLRKLEAELKEDSSLNFDLKTEALTKRLVSDKVNYANTPDSARNKIISSLISEYSQKQKGPAFQKSIYSRKFLTLSTFGVVILAIVLILLNRPDTNLKKISDQYGKNNMVVLAQQNFENYLNGKDLVEFTSDNPKELQNYFRENGVNYDILVPRYEDYTLLGGFITEHKGVKLAHHIYTSKDGKYIYVFQVHESYFKGDSIIKLTNDLLDYLSEGKHYKSNNSSYVTILKKQNQNVFAVVSNLPEEDLPKNIYR